MAASASNPPTGAGGLASERKAREWIDAQPGAAIGVVDHRRRRLPGARRSGRLRHGQDSLDVSVEASSPDAVERRLDVAAGRRQQRARRGVEDLVGRGARPVRAARRALAVPPGDAPRPRRHARRPAPARRRPSAGFAAAGRLAERRGAAQLPAELRALGGDRLCRRRHRSRRGAGALGRSSSSPSPGSPWSVVGNAVIGLTRIAVDGRLLAVRQVAPLAGSDRRRRPRRHRLRAGGVDGACRGAGDSSRPSAGPPLRRSAYQGFDRELAERLHAARRPTGRHRVLRPRLPVAGLPAPPGAVRAPVVGARQRHGRAGLRPRRGPILGSRRDRNPGGSSRPDRQMAPGGRRPSGQAPHYGPYSGYSRSPVARKPGDARTDGLSGGGP